MIPSHDPLRHLGGPGDKPAAGASPKAPVPEAEEKDDSKALQPKDVAKGPDGGLEWTWADGHVSPFALKYLRARCPCANCVDEWTGKRRLDPATVAPDVSAQSFEPVGHYAVRFQWSDGHNTGLYSFRYLRSICPCAACKAARGE